MGTTKRADLEFTRFVQKVAKQSGYTDAQLAEEVGVDRSTITRWRNGNTRPHRALRPVLEDRFDQILYDRDYGYNRY